ncbi:hypothetical protein ABZ372_21855 [Streptomyces sp. NPDC005921]
MNSEVFMGVRRRRRRPAAALAAVGLAFRTLEVWTRSNPDPAATYERVFATLTKKAGIKIDYQPVINFDQQLQSRASTKDLPDVMINDTALMGSYQAQGLLKTVGLDGRHYANCG